MLSPSASSGQARSKHERLTAVGFSNPTYSFGTLRTDFRPSREFLAPLFSNLIWGKRNKPLSGH
ncbi:MAG: hypothetical protein A2Z75_04260 [Chloroflexi bacterium RBG_13_50_10]|nr:MAG: hypothetical protein A2Z75_04260 [Chloroflexi bacterium RBG_13_50_10]